MIISYRFYEGSFDYEIEHDEYLKAIHKILKKETKESLIDMIVDFDMCKVDLSDMLEDELKCYFEGKAYEEFLDRRGE